MSNLETTRKCLVSRIKLTLFWIWRQVRNSTDLIMFCISKRANRKSSSKLGVLSLLMLPWKATQQPFLLMDKQDREKLILCVGKNKIFTAMDGHQAMTTDYFCNRLDTCSKKCLTNRVTFLSKPVSLRFIMSSWETSWTHLQECSTLDGTPKMGFLLKTWWL